MIYHWKEGEPLDPVRLGVHELERIKQEIGSFMFSAQYLQQPVPAEGNMIKRERFKWYMGTIAREPGDDVIQSWDLATSVAESADYSVCTTWLVRNQNYYLLHVERSRGKFPEVKKRFFELADHYDPSAILVEKAGPGLMFLQDLWSNDLLPFVRPLGITPEGGKVDRMRVHSAKIENGSVVLPVNAPWLEGYLNELLAFPSSKYDDQVDSTSQFLQWIKSRTARERLSAGHGCPVFDDLE